MKRIDAYQAYDGKVFDTREAAELHELKLDLKKKYDLDPFKDYDNWIVHFDYFYTWLSRNIDHIYPLLTKLYNLRNGK